CRLFTRRRHPCGPGPGDDGMTAASTATGLVWAFKRSFVQYIAQMPDGRMSVTGGADVDGMNFHFEILSVAGNSDSGTLAFRGDVRFAGHGNLLFVGIADPVIVFDGAAPMVSGQLPSNLQGAPERLDLASGSLALTQRQDQLERYAVSGLGLTEAGSDLFGCVYPPGETRDHL